MDGNIDIELVDVCCVGCDRMFDETEVIQDVFGDVPVFTCSKCGTAYLSSTSRVVYIHLTRCSPIKEDPDKPSVMTRI